jgi:outer membrane immunogenic protein
MRKSLLLSFVALGAIASSAFAADLPTHKGPPPAPIVVAPPFSWTGFYGGLNGGYADPTAKLSVAAPAGSGWATDHDWTANANGPGVAAVGTDNIGLHGFIGGAQAGYNYQINNIVIGAEADADYMNLNGSYSTPHYSGFAGGTPPNDTYWASGSASVDSLFTLRLRAGLAVDHWLFFVTGGLAVTGEKFSQSINYLNYAAPPPPITLPSTGPGGGANAGSASTTAVTGVIGGGVEYAFDKNWSIKGEYLYVPLKSLDFTSVSTANAAYTIQHHEGLSALNVFRIGLNYRFN